MVEVIIESFVDVFLISSITCVLLFLQGIIIYYLSKRAGYWRSWLSFVPFMVWLPAYYVTGRSWWSLIWVGVILINILLITFFTNLLSPVVQGMLLKFL